VAFFASVARAVSGFGHAAILAPVLSYFLHPKDVVAISNLTKFAVDVSFIVVEKPVLEKGETYAGSLVGVTIGALIFGIISQKALGVTVGVCILALALLFLRGLKFKVRRESLLLAFAGFTSGLMGILTSVSGPQIALALTNQGYPAYYVRKYVMTYMTVADAMVVSGLAFTGQIGTGHIALSVAILPAILLGYWTGRRALKRLRPEALERLILAVVALSSLILVIKSILA